MDRTEQIHQWIQEDIQWVKSLFSGHDAKVDYMTSISGDLLVWINIFKNGECVEFAHGQTLTEAIKSLQKKISD